MVEEQDNLYCASAQNHFHCLITLHFVTIVQLFLSIQLDPLTYARCKPSFNHELLWALGMSRSLREIVRRRKMRTLF